VYVGDVFEANVVLILQIRNALTASSHYDTSYTVRAHWNTSPTVTLDRASTFVRLAGVWVSFSRHSPNWVAVQNYFSPSQETTGPKYRKDQ
jgi:hypothetical protein